MTIAPPKFGKPAAPPTKHQLKAGARGAQRGTREKELNYDSGRADALLRRFD